MCWEVRLWTWPAAQHGVCPIGLFSLGYSGTTCQRSTPWGPWAAPVGAPRVSPPFPSRNAVCSTPSGSVSPASGSTSAPSHRKSGRTWRRRKPPPPQGPPAGPAPGAERGLPRASLVPGSPSAARQAGCPKTGMGRVQRFGPSTSWVSTAAAKVTMGVWGAEAGQGVGFKEICASSGLGRGSCKPLGKITPVVPRPSHPGNPDCVNLELRELRCSAKQSSHPASTWRPVSRGWWMVVTPWQLWIVPWAPLAQGQFPPVSRGPVRSAWASSARRTPHHLGHGPQLASVSESPALRGGICSVQVSASHRLRISCSVALYGPCRVTLVFDERRIKSFSSQVRAGSLYKCLLFFSPFFPSCTSDNSHNITHTAPGNFKK